MSVHDVSPVFINIDSSIRRSMAFATGDRRLLRPNWKYPIVARADRRGDEVRGNDGCVAGGEALGRRPQWADCEWKDFKCSVLHSMKANKIEA